jgi:hypothetical protein
MIKDIQKIFDRIDYILERAAKIQAETATVVANTGAVLKPVPGKDKTVAKFVLHLASKPDLDRLGLLFGELIHHLRSTLDNLVAVTALHKMPQMPSKELKRIAFIIAETESEWDKLVGKIKALPKEYIDEIRQVQPFNGFGTFVGRTDSLLVLLRDLDNQDKHHLQLLPSLNQLSGAIELSMSFEDSAAADRALPPRTTLRDIKFEDGANLFDIEVNEPIKDIRGIYNVEAELIVESDGIKYNVPSILTQLVYAVQVIVDRIQFIEDPQCVTFRVLKRAAQ